MTWLNENKEWFFSGTGIFIVSSIFSIISIVFTIILKEWVEKKKKKKLNLKLNLEKIFLHNLDKDELFSNNLHVLYENQEYANLCYIEIFVKNIGTIAIREQGILLSLPKETILIDKHEVFSNSTIKVINDTETIYGDNKEIVKKIDRLEPEEYASFVYIVDTKEVEKINVKQRWESDTIYIEDNKLKSSTDIYGKLLLIIAYFIFFDSLPFVGGYFKTLVLIINFSTLKEIIVMLLTKKEAVENNIMIKGNNNLDINISK